VTSLSLLRARIFFQRLLDFPNYTAAASAGYYYPEPPSVGSRFTLHPTNTNTNTNTNFGVVCF
jgi:hypothetical protein